jgi:hypothetical protein
VGSCHWCTAQYTAVISLGEVHMNVRVRWMWGGWETLHNIAEVHHNYDNGTGVPTHRVAFVTKEHTSFTYRCEEIREMEITEESEVLCGYCGHTLSREVQTNGAPMMYCWKCGNWQAC